MRTLFFFFFYMIADYFCFAYRFTPLSYAPLLIVDAAELMALNIVYA